MSIWLIGAGPMAEFHAAVLADLGRAFSVVARSAERAGPLAAKYGAEMIVGGLEAALAGGVVPEHAIVVLPVDGLAAATRALIEAGVRSILVEKPGGLDGDDVEPVAIAAEARGAEVFVAYNRRFFAAVLEAERRIAAADRILSMVFEFTEDADRIEQLPTAARIKSRWVLANSSHVIDLAFHLCGAPAGWTPEVSGALAWHPSGADFRGTGTTTRGARFSYLADWRGPGRWGIEIVLPGERLVLRPMEKLQSVPRGRFEAQPVEIDDEIDRRFKPGIHRQMVAFLGGEGRERLLRLDEHLDHLRRVIEPMAGYSSSR